MTTPNLLREAVLNDELLTRTAGISFRAFVALAWPILEPGTPLLPSYYIDLICEYLEAITAGDKRTLVINVPPRYGKSTLVSVLWPTWEWIRTPSMRYLCASYSEDIAIQHALSRLRVLRSDWYQRRWGHIVHLMRDQHAKAEFHNTRRGMMVATSMGGAITGKGGNRLIIDDPHNPFQAESDTLRRRALEAYRLTLSTRLDDKYRGAIVVVMQRLHTADLTALCLELGFEHLCLPAVASTRTTIIFPRSGYTVTREAGDILCPAREDRAKIEEQRIVLGPSGFSAQYQQNPVTRDGGYFPADRWRFFDEAPTGGELIQSWDLAFKGTEDSDFVVGLVIRRVGAKLYLLDRVKGQWDFNTTVEQIKRLKKRWPETSTVLVESAANGEAAVNLLRKDIPGILAVTAEGGKRSRAAAAQVRVEAGQVYVPRFQTEAGVCRPEYGWAADFVEQCARFPKGAHDDDVDAFTQAVAWTVRNRSTEPAGASFDQEPPVKLRHPIVRRRQTRMFHRRSEWDWNRWYDSEDDDGSS